MSAQTQELVNLLSQLMSTNNALRSNAEKQFESFSEQQTSVMVSLLLEVFMNPNENVVIRTYTTILLRRTVEKYYSNLPQDFMLQFREKLFYVWKQEATPSLALKLTHVISQTAFKMDWKHLVPEIIQYGSNSGNLDFRTSMKALTLLEILVDYCPEDVSLHFQVIGQFLTTFFGLNANTSNEFYQLCLQSSKSTLAVISTLENDESRNAFRPALPFIQQILEKTLQLDHENESKKIIEYFVTIAEVQPLFFKNSFDSLMSLMINIASNENLEFSIRSIAVELIITISESAPAIARRSQGFIAKTLEVIMKLLLTLEDNENEWKRGKYSLHDDDANDDDEEETLLAAEAIQRLATGLGGKSVSDIIFQYVQQFSSHADWKYRRAAIVAMHRLIEGATKYLTNSLNQVIQFLFNSLQDRSVRVQYETIQTVGRLASLYTDELPTLVEKFLPPLASLMADANNCDKIRGHSASALINLLNPQFLENNEILEKYLEPLLQALVVTFGNAPYEVKSPCLSILGCVAQVCPEPFVQYYDQFMPGIKNILLEATSPELIELRGKAMECAGLIGDAVGVEKFSKDAIEIMKILFHLMNVDDDITFEYILPACARIAKAIKYDFIQYLPIIFPKLLQGASQEIQFSFEDAAEDDVEGEVTKDDENGTESAVVSLGAGTKKRITLHTSSLEQKANAMKVLFELSSSLGCYLGEFIIPSLQCVLKAIGERYSTEVRYSCASALPKLFKSLVLILKQPHAYPFVCPNGMLPNSFTVLNIPDIFQQSVAFLMDAIKLEPDHETKYAQVDGLRDLFDIVYMTGTEEIDGNHLSGFILTIHDQLQVQIIQFLLLQCAELVVERNNIQEITGKNDALDEEDKELQMEESLEQIDSILTIFIDIIGHLVKLGQSSSTIMTIFDKMIAPAFSSYLSPQQPLSLQRMACCLMDDVIEFGGNASHKYIPSLLPIYLMNTQNMEDIILRQCSMYGLCMMVYKSPEILLSTPIPPNTNTTDLAGKTFIGPLLSCFVTTILHPEAYEEDNAGITENAVFGLLNLIGNPIYKSELTHYSQHFPILEIYSLTLKKLPLKLDSVEIKISMNLLIGMIERNDPILFMRNGPNNNSGDYLFFQDLLRIFGDILALYYSNQLKALQQQSSPNSITAVTNDGNQNDEDEDEENGLKGTKLLHETTKNKMENILKNFQENQMIKVHTIQEFGFNSQQILKTYSS